MVVDGDMHVLPARAARMHRPIRRHPVAGALETPEFLDVEVQHLAGRVVFVALNRRRRLQAGEPVQTLTNQHASDAAVADVQALADLAIRLAFGTRSDDACLSGFGKRLRTVMRARAAIDEPIRAFFAETAQPFVGGAHTHARRLRGFFGTQAVLQDAFDQQGSTARR